MTRSTLDIILLILTGTAAVVLVGLLIVMAVIRISDPTADVADLVLIIDLSLGALIGATLGLIGGRILERGQHTDLP